MTKKIGFIVIYSSLLLSLVLGFSSSSINTKILTESDFSNFKLFQSVVSVLATFLSFGIFSTAAVLYLRRRSDLRYEKIRSGVFLHLLISCLFLSIFVFIFLVYRDPGNLIYLIAISFFSGLTPFFLFFQEMFRAKGSYALIALSNCFVQTGYFFIVLLFWYHGVSSSFIGVALLFFTLQFFLVLYFLFRDKFSLDCSFYFYNFLIGRNKKIGLNVYAATLIATLTAQFPIFFLDYGGNSRDLMFFSLASTLSAPISMIPSSIGTLYFSDLSGGRRYPLRVIYLLLSATLLTVLLFAFFSPFVVDFLYGPSFDKVVFVSIGLAVASALQGVGDVFNRFFLANSRTKFLLNSAIFSFFILILSALFLFPLYGVVGLSVAKLISSLFYCALMYSFYCR